MKANRALAQDSIKCKMQAPDSPSPELSPAAESDGQRSLQPTAVVTRKLHEGAALASQGDLSGAARCYREAAEVADGDRAGFGRANAQLAALEESCGQIEDAFMHNRLAQQAFLDIGDGPGLVQVFRVEAFLHLRAGEQTAAASSFARALCLALQLDSRLVLTTLDQVVPAARHLIGLPQVDGLLQLGAALTEAVESAKSGQLADMGSFSELAATIAGVLAPLGVMASEPQLPAGKRRTLAARATHQAWLVDALTRRRWSLASMVKETLQNQLDFHEELD